MASMIGKNLGSYTVEDEIGSGGMGVVLLARQCSLDRPAVLKRIRRELCEMPELLERFRREARTAAAIHHQNVVAVYDCFSWHKCEYIAQEYVDGVDLATVLSRCGPLPSRIATMIALEVVRGLEEIHAHGTVHRDLKPHNILLGRRGEVKIGDFGLALEATGSSLTQPGVMIGSPPYMPPEQMLGERVDARCDLFSVGVVCYEMLTGRLPYPDPNPEDRSEHDDEEIESLLVRMQRERYTRLRKQCPKAPRVWARIVKGCLRAKPKNRIPSAAEIRRTLERMLGPLSPEDLRCELAAWLWDHQVFRQRENETVVRLAAPLSGARGPQGSVAWLPGFGAAALLAACVLWVGPEPPSRGISTSVRPKLDRLSDGARDLAQRAAALPRIAFDLDAIRADLAKRDAGTEGASLDPRDPRERESQASDPAVDAGVGLAAREPGARDVSRER